MRSLAIAQPQTPRTSLLFGGVGPATFVAGCSPLRLLPMVLWLKRIAQIYF
jgi:hypothetical protein